MCSIPLLFVPVIVSRLSPTNVDVPLEIPPIIKGFDKKFSIFSEAPIVVPTFPIAEGAPKIPPNAPPNAEPIYVSILENCTSKRSGVLRFPFLSE